MKARVYIETTIPSYLTAWPSTNVVLFARQQVTHDWWQMQRAKFNIYTSALVLHEASQGDEQAATKRLEVLSNIPLLDLSEDAYRLAQALVDPGMLPISYFDDALHVAIAVLNGMDYLLTWNLKHIANATLRNKFEPRIRSLGYEVPIICTPEELMP